MLVQSLKQRAPGWLAAGRRIYAVGDVHGCADRLQRLHAIIAADLDARPIGWARLIHLGDFLDRGPDSARAVAMLAAGAPTPQLEMVVLRGNHEQMMLDAMAGEPGALEAWRANGGDAALRSWSIKRPKHDREWATKLPLPDTDFLGATRVTHAVDGYLFVHAGVRPGVALADQVPDDLLWIRRPFLDSTGPLLPDAPGVAVVHGHTPEAMPIVTGNRIGVDTGAVRGGALTCAVLEAGEVAFLSV